MSDSATSEATTEKSSLLDHLIEMRDRLLRAVIVVGIAFVCLFPFSKDIYNWLAAPLVDQGQEMLIIGPVAPFLIPMKLTLMVAFLIALPYLFYQLWSFVAPGLYKHEKRLIYPLIASSILLFYIGIAFVYYILLPMMFKIIPQFAPEVAVFSPDIAQYLDFTIMMFIAFGFGFEMPIATILLISTGITTAEELKKKRPYVIVAAFVVGMFLTPPDVISQIMLAVPMWLLFELGLVFSTVFNVRVKEAGDARKEIDENYSSRSSSPEAIGKNTAKKVVAASTPASSTAKAVDKPVILANEMWEDRNEPEDYLYDDELEEIEELEEEDAEESDVTPHGEYKDADSFDMGSGQLAAESNDVGTEEDASHIDQYTDAKPDDLIEIKPESESEQTSNTEKKSD